MADLSHLQQRLGVRFSDESLLRQALTHPSATQGKAQAKGPEGSPELKHNQRLEFLGDAVLQLGLSQLLYQTFSDADEGALSKARAKLVNGQSLAGRARALTLGSHLILSTGEEQNGGRERASILGDAFEAVLGALFLDQGFAVAQAFIAREFADELSGQSDADGIDNPKGELQELMQAQGKQAPEYRITAASGADHDRAFECAVWHGGEELARGQGKSKKDAEAQAALAALKKIRDSSPN